MACFAGGGGGERVWRNVMLKMVVGLVLFAFGVYPASAAVPRSTRMEDVEQMWRSPWRGGVVFAPETATRLLDALLVDSSTLGRAGRYGTTQSDGAQQGLADGAVSGAHDTREFWRKFVSPQKQPVRFESFLDEQREQQGWEDDPVREMQAQMGDALLVEQGVEREEAEKSEANATGSAPCFGLGVLVNSTRMVYVCDNVTVTQAEYDASDPTACTTRLQNVSLCVCPFDRVGSNCEKPRQTDCGVTYVTPLATCRKDDGQLHYEADSECLVLSQLADFIDINVTIDCSFLDTADVLRGSSEDVPLDNWAINQSFPYRAVLYETNVVGAVTGVRFAVSQQLGVRLRMRFVNFFRLFTDERGVIYTTPDADALVGTDSTHFSVSPQYLPTLFFAGGLPYFEVAFESELDGLVQVRSTPLRVSVRVEDLEAEPRGFPVWAAMLIAFFSAVILLTTAFVLHRVFWRQNLFLLRLLDDLPYVPQLLLLRLAVWAGFVDVADLANLELPSSGTAGEDDWEGEGKEKGGDDFGDGTTEKSSIRSSDSSSASSPVSSAPSRVGELSQPPTTPIPPPTGISTALFCAAGKATEVAAEPQEDEAGEQRSGGGFEAASSSTPDGSRAPLDLVPVSEALQPLMPHDSAHEDPRRPGMRHRINSGKVGSTDSEAGSTARPSTGVLNLTDQTIQ